MSQIKQISYEEAMRRFRNVYRMEKLPHEPVASADWYASQEACGALVWVGKDRKLARIKGTVTAPESRGQGHGDALLRHLEAEAALGGAQGLEVYAKNPAWYQRNGWQVKRITKWGTTVLTKQL
jgi:ribosomal protein S18 acetylase RimI-like enzyme